MLSASCRHPNLEDSVSKVGARIAVGDGSVERMRWEEKKKSRAEFWGFGVVLCFVQYGPMYK